MRRVLFLKDDNVHISNSLREWVVTVDQASKRRGTTIDDGRRREVQSANSWKGTEETEVSGMIRLVVNWLVDLPNTVERSKLKTIG